ncbi:MAG: hypothetical protein QM662_16450, partial [Gordonia sp. (in: high G+C Gram-positive bacteria)]
PWRRATRPPKNPSSSDIGGERMTEYRFNDQQVEAILTDIENQVRRFDSELVKFETAKMGLKAFWEGDESEIYEAIFSRFQLGATEVRNIVAQVHNALADAGEENNQMRHHMRIALGQ